jgi:ATP-dependent DNA ligase
MALPLVPPVTPMLARLVRELPTDGFVYEPKWDGFRAVAFRDGPSVDLQSRNQRPLTRYFPELAEAFRAVAVEQFVLDGEIVVLGPDGRFDFPALMSRLHPAASRVRRLREESPTMFIAFDLLATDDADLCGRPFTERRARLEALLASPPIGWPEVAPAVGDVGEQPIALSTTTQDRAVAAGWLEAAGSGGVDGVMAKHRSLLYLPGRRVMLKVKPERTADCVVAGFRWLWDRPALGSLLLGLYDAEGTLRHVGVTSSFSREARQALLEDLAPLATPLEGHPWEHGFGLDRSPVGRLAGAAGRWVPAEMDLDWVPLRPELVCEVAYQTLDDHRLRFPARFRRWRPDRDPASCTFGQLDVAHPDLRGLLWTP